MAHYLTIVILVLLGALPASFGVLILAHGRLEGLIPLIIGVALWTIAWAGQRHHRRDSTATLSTVLKHVQTTVVIHRRRSSAWLILLAIALSGWVIAFVLLQPWLSGHALIVALAIGTLVATAFAPRLLSDAPLLALDATGIVHPHIGRIDWRDIDGIRVIDPARRNRPGLMQFLLRDPDRHAAILGGLQGRMLRSSGMLGVPLALAQVDALDIFETATRLRRAINQDFLSAFSVASPRLDRVHRLLQNASTIGSPDPQIQRLRDLQMAASGGWSSLDTLEMARERLAILRENTQRSARRIETIDSEFQAAMMRGASNAELDALAQHHVSSAMRDIEQTARNPRLMALDTRVKRRARWQMLMIVIAITIYVLLRMWARNP